MKRNEQGYLLILAVVLIVIVAVIVGVIAHLFITTISSGSDYLLSKQSFYVAESGLEYGIRDLRTTLNASGGWSNLSIYCDGSWKTVQGFGTGQFRFKCNLYTPSPLSTLSAPISDTNNIIPVSSLTNYAPLGRVNIDAELIHYNSVSSENSVCGQENCGGGSCPAPCLIVKTRGAEDTAADAHAMGTSVIQPQPHVVITSQGVVPSFSNVLGNTIVMNSVHLTQTGSGNFWAVGQRGRIMKWDPIGGWQNVVCRTCADRLDNYEFYGVSCANSNDCWAVGLAGGGRRFVHWNGTSWSPTSQFLPGTLRAISCVDSNHCWAVGDGGIIIDWDGSTWSSVSSPTVNTLRGVSCVDANDCWAVGDSGRIIHWNGSYWSVFAGPLYLLDLNAVDCVNGNLCWTVGDWGIIYRWNGFSWSFIFWPGWWSANLLSISCGDADHCWASSSSSNRFAQYESGSWNRVVTGLPASTNYNGIACSNADLCFVVANTTGNSTVIGQWERGVGWSRLNPAHLKPSDDLYAISLNGPGGGSTTTEVTPFVWSPVFS